MAPGCLPRPCSSVFLSQYSKRRQYKGRECDKGGTKLRRSHLLQKGKGVPFRWLVLTRSRWQRARRVGLCRRLVHCVCLCVCVWLCVLGRVYMGVCGCVWKYSVPYLLFFPHFLYLYNSHKQIFSLANDILKHYPHFHFHMQQFLALNRLFYLNPHAVKIFPLSVLFIDERVERMTRASQKWFISYSLHNFPSYFPHSLIVPNSFRFFFSPSRVLWEVQGLSSRKFFLH